LRIIIITPLYTTSNVTSDFHGPLTLSVAISLHGSGGKVCGTENSHVIGQIDDLGEANIYRCYIRFLRRFVPKSTLILSVVREFESGTVATMLNWELCIRSLNAGTSQAVFSWVGVGFELWGEVKLLFWAFGDLNVLRAIR
jgi:hypothetical protein